MAGYKYAVLSFTGNPNTGNTNINFTTGANILSSYDISWSSRNKPTLEETIDEVVSRFNDTSFLNDYMVAYRHLDKLIIEYYNTDGGYIRYTTNTTPLVTYRLTDTYIYYGLKYELNFSDIDENPRKLQILEKDYTGVIKPIIGTASPCVLRYEEPNEDYSPILASNLTVNLIETDDVSYENFYTQGERQFKVILWYKDSNDVWRHYWQGFIIPDTYFQPIRTKPFNISFKAVCGLSLLKGVAHTLNNGEYYTGREYLEECFKDLGDYIEEDGIKRLSGTVSCFDGFKLNSATFFDNIEYPMDRYDILKNILGVFNYYVCLAPNTSGVSVGSSFRLMNYGIHESLANVLSIKNDLKVIGSELMKYNKGAVNKVTFNSEVNYSLGVINGSFQDGSFNNWTITEPPGNQYPAEVVSDESIKSVNSAKIPLSLDGGTILSQYSTYKNFLSYSSFTFSFKFLYDGDLSVLPQLIYSITARIDTGSGYITESLVSTDNYHVRESGIWISKSITFEVPYEGDFIDNPMDMNFSFIPYLDTTTPSSGIKGNFYLDDVKLVANDIYNEKGYDNDFSSNAYVRVATPTNPKGTNTIEFNDYLITSFDDIYNNGKINSITTNDIDDADGVITFRRYGYDVEALPAERIKLQQVLNDATNEYSFYEGTVRCLNVNPLFITDVIAIDYDDYSESRKVLPIALEYDVKANEYNFTGYLASTGTTDIPFDFVTNSED